MPAVYILNLNFMSGVGNVTALSVVRDDVAIDPALVGMEGVEGRDISGPSAIGSQLEELRLWLVEIGVATGAHFGVRTVDGKARIVSLDEGNEVVGILPDEQRDADEEASTRGGVSLQVLEGGR